jgi:hypothetical protein
MIPATAVDRFLLRSSPHECGTHRRLDTPQEAGNATHPLARPVVRLPLYPQGVGRIRKAAKAAMTPLSLLLAYRGGLRTREGQAGAVKPLTRQQPRSRRFVADTRPNAPSGVSDYGC